MQRISYADAILQAFRQKMEQDSSVFIIGQGVKNPWYVGTTMTDLNKQFGEKKVVDPPVSEQGVNGIVIGAALAGMRPIVVHPRLDFLMVGAEQIINQAANWCYMFEGKINVPLVVRGIINRGGEQGAQHSQALQSTFMHMPGLKVVMPATPYDAKGLLIASIEDNNPVIFIDDRWLYDEIGTVPEEMYSVPIGQGVVKRKGADITVVAISYMVVEAIKAAAHLEAHGIDVEVIDVRSIKPLDKDIIFQSVRKTGRLVIAEAAWKTGSVAGEIAALVAENVFEKLKAPIQRVTLPDVPAPTSRSLEKAFYIGAEDIVSAVFNVMNLASTAKFTDTTIRNTKASIETKRRTQALADNIRKHIVQMTHASGASHVGTSLSTVDLLATLYSGVLDVDPNQPDWPERDRFIMSKGHGCSALYATLAEVGFFPTEWLDTFYQNGSALIGHVTYDIPGVDVSTGSLGHGLSMGCGMAILRKRAGSKYRVFSMLSDGECDEGSTWEAALFAGHHGLDGLVAIVDYNKIQSMGRVEEVLNLDPLADKWEKFGWAVREIDGHNLDDISNTFGSLPFENGKPSCIIAHTIKGKGVSFMENRLLWHYRSPDPDEYRQAMSELQEA